MIITVKNIIKVLLGISLILWALLTVIVLIAIVDKWVHPDTKGISSLDFKNYIQISVVCIGLSILFNLILNFIKDKLEKSS